MFAERTGHLLSDDPGLRSADASSRDALLARQLADERGRGVAFAEAEAAGLPG